MSEAGEKVAQATRQRAAIYAHLFKVLRARFGEQAAVEAMSAAIFAHGRDKAEEAYSPAARKGDLAAAAREFASPDPVKQHQFAPRVIASDDREAVIAMSRCPLVEQWRSMDLPPDEIALLCRIARAVDFGTWEGALGFALDFEGTRGDGKDECVLRVRRKTPEGDR